MVKRFAAICIVVLACLVSSCAYGDYYLQKTVDLSSIFCASSELGTSPYSVAYDGVSAYVGGYLEGTAPGTIGVAKVGGLGYGEAATFAALAGTVIASNSLEGYNAIAIGSAGGAATLYAGKDGANSGGTKIISVDAATGNLVSTFGTGGVLTNPGGRTRIHGGIDIDPGYGGEGYGLSHLEFGQGRRQLVDAATGAEIYGVTGDPAPGFVVFLDSSSFRGHAYNPATGDLYIRVQNDVQRHLRSGVNSVTGSGKIVDLVNAPYIVGQNIEFIGGGLGSGGSELIIFNDRTATEAGQPFLTRVILRTPTGAATPVQLLTGQGGILTLQDGNGLYDFAYFGATDTLLVTDFFNKSLYVFGNGMVPEPSSLLVLTGALLGSAGMLVRRRRS